MPFRKPAALLGLICVAACGLIFGGADSSLSAQTLATWYREPTISPDGTTILFTAYGDIWSVPVGGGTATAVTHDDGWEGYPVWSRDGSHIAFASDRFGDLDVFVMNADGSDLTRLTFYDVDDIPSDFSPDGARVLFSSGRTGSAQSSYFPTRALPQLYEVAITGGAPRMVFTNPAREAHWSPDGSQIVYREEKSYESEYRQRDAHAFARDIWIYDAIDDTHRKITTNPHGDHSPVWSADGTAIYMQSESDDQSFNVRRLDLGTGESTYLTHHGPQPARGLSRSNDGLLAYSFHGAIYTVRDGEDPQLVDIQLSGGHLADAPTPLGAPTDITEFSVSPDGSEIAFISRGEVFVTDREFSDTVRITDTPEQERSVSFAPDGRSLLYASERDGSWAIFETNLSDQNEPRFSAASDFAERLVYRAEGTDAFQPVYSPDGEKVAFLYDRDEIRVVDLDGSNVHTVFPGSYNYSYSDGDIHFAWSPDSNWITADYAARGYYFYTDIGVAPADGSAPPRDIALNGYQDGRPEWHMSGDVIYYGTERFGLRSEGQWGAQQDVVAAFLTEDAWNRFNLTQQERSLLNAHQDDESGDDDSDSDDDGSDDDTPAIDINAYLNLSPPRGEDEPITIDFDGIENRTARLTSSSSDLAGAALTSDMSALYYLAAFEGGYDLWRHDLVKDETTKVASVGATDATMAITPDDARVIVLADGVLLQGELGDTVSLAPVSVSGEVTVHENEERAYLFDHVWRQVADKFYDPDMHGLDWNAVRAAYEPKVAAINNDRDFATMMSEMLGQLNASHTGMYYRNHQADDDQTASLGAIFSTDSQPGLVIAEVLPEGPLDRETYGISPGDRIVAVGGTRIDATTNPYSLLNRRAGDRIRLTIAGQTGGEHNITVRAYARTDEVEALYQRWIDRRRDIVETRSNGRIGYVHIRSMDDEGYRQIFSELFGRNFDKDAVVVDTRFNGGGWLHDQLLTLLDGKPYFGVRVRGRTMRGDPVDRWTKPSIVVMNEGNYSNAFMFPYAYHLFGIGQTVGMPVPGTGTAVWWEYLQTGDLIFGIPQVAELDQQGVPLENQELEPDILVDNPPEAGATGGDRPLEAAVDALLAGLDAQQ